MKNKKFTTIFIGILAIVFISSCATKSKNSSFSNMVGRMEVKEPIEGVCDNANVIAILPFPGNGQIKAEPSKSKEEITKELNSNVSFLKDNPDYEDKGMVSLIINCKGELVRSSISNKTKSPELDNQIVEVFAELKKWSPGKINNKLVDTVVLYSFTIENGKIILK